MTDSDTRTEHFTDGIERLAYYAIAAIGTGITLAVGSRSPAWSVEVGVALVAITSIIVVAVDLKSQYLHTESDRS